MTELIVALDGPDPLRLIDEIWRQTSVKWFKIGPQAVSLYDWTFIIGYAKDCNLKLFLDLKLVDTRDTITEAVKRFDTAEIAAVSTYSDEATEAAMSVKRRELRVWQLMILTDSKEKYLPNRKVMADGAICPGWAIDLCKKVGYEDIITPGVRFAGSDINGHRITISPNDCKSTGSTHIVVGRPIWQAIDPISAARRYLDALSD